METFTSLAPDKQQRIINAALEEFTRRSYQDASTNTITQAAGISKGALFHYFGNKQKLYDYLIDYVREQVQTTVLADFPESTDLIELFIIFSERKAKLARVHPLMYAFLYKVFQEDPPQAKYVQIVGETMRLMNQLFQDQVDVSKFRPGISLEQAIEICTWVTEGFGKKYAQKNPELDVDLMMKEADNLFQTLRLMLYREDI